MLKKTDWIQADDFCIKILQLSAVLAVLFFLTGCDTTSDTVHLQLENNFYLTSDENDDYRLKGDRPEPRLWETFTLIYTKENTVKIKNFKHLYVSYDSLRSNGLFADIYKCKNRCDFVLSATDTNYYYLLTSDHKPVCIDDDKHLFVSDAEDKSPLKLRIIPFRKKLFNSYFPDRSIFLLIISSILIAASLIAFHLNKSRFIYLSLLTLGAFGIRLFAITLNDYLYLWDEQFHALVAKNLLHDPLKPVLYSNPVLPYDYKNWTGNHIWLHKQPFFLWQIAVSLKIFGIHPFAVRVPSAIMSTLMVLLIYRIGQILVSEKIAYYSAIVYSFLNFYLILTSGYLNTDHNDVAFIFFVSASIWTFLEYRRSGSQGWMVLTGLFAGFAVLTKWLTGLLIYLIWGVCLLLERRLFNFRDKQVHHMLISLLITCIIVIPWQVYIFIKYPLESAYESALNTQHFFIPVEHHTGTWLYHFDQAKDIYGFPFVLLAFFLFLFLRKIVDKPVRYAILFSIVFVYIFFTLAATKMPAFTAILGVFFILSIGSAISGFFDILIINKDVVSPDYLPVLDRTYRIIAIALLCVYLMNIEKIQFLHTEWKKDQSDLYVKRRNNFRIYRNHSALLNNQETVVVNAPYYDTVPLMFEFKATVYSRVEEEEFRALKQLPYQLIVFDNGETPDYMLEDESVIVIDAKALLY